MQRRRHTHSSRGVTVSEIKIQAEPRTEFGKGAARRIRRANRVPVVLYGHGTDPLHVTLPGHDLMLALKVAPTRC
jgi:large subunit ribosomal protein L25